MFEYRSDRPSTLRAVAAGRSNVLQPAGSRGRGLQIGSYRARIDEMIHHGVLAIVAATDLMSLGYLVRTDHVPSRERDPQNCSADGSLPFPRSPIASSAPGSPTFSSRWLVGIPSIWRQVLEQIAAVTKGHLHPRDFRIPRDGQTILRLGRSFP